MLPRKTERKITFKQFEDALKLLAEKKYGSASDVGKLESVILKTEGPKTSGATVSFYESLYGDLLQNKHLWQFLQHFPDLRCHFRTQCCKAFVKAGLHDHFHMKFASHF